MSDETGSERAADAVAPVVDLHKPEDEPAAFARPVFSAAPPPPPPHSPPQYGTTPFGTPVLPPAYPAPATYVFPVFGGPAEPEAEPSPPPRRRALLAVVALALVCGLAGGGAGALVQHHRSTSVTLHQPASGSPERAADSVPGLAARTLPGVVYIHVVAGRGSSSGTGFVLDKAGYLLTNNHVVEQAAGGNARIVVTFSDGQQVEARVVGRDAGYDLAVLKVDGVRGLSPLPLGNSDAVQVGDPVIAIGAPYGLDGTVTTGIVSAKDRPVSAGGGTGKDVSYISALQTDAAINPGNSGGPLINAAGQVVGVNSAIRSAAGAAGPGDGTTEEGAGSIGLGFSIPVNQARRIAGELIEHGRAAHPVIGVAVDMAYRGGGARLSEQTAEGQGPVVRPGGPADKAGLKPGEVVVSMDGRRIVDGKDLIVSIRARVPGDRVKLVVRDAGGAERTVELVLEGEGGKG